MTHRQRNVIRRPRQLRLTYADRAVAIFLELRKELSNPQRTRSCNNSQWPVGLPASITWAKQLVLDRAAHSRGDQAYVSSLNGRPAGNGRGSQKDHTPRRLLWIPFQKPVNHQPAQAVSDKMQPSGLQLAYEPLQPRSDLTHRRSRRRIPERMHLHSELPRETPTEQQRLTTGHPEPMNVNYCFPHTSGRSWPLRDGDDISKKWDCNAWRRRASE